VRRTEGQRLVEPVVGSLDTTQFAEREVVIVDDICDEGRTLESVLHLVQGGRPRKVVTAVLVSKLERRISPVRLDHVGFTLATGWVVGCGMDLDGELRDLEHLAILDESSGE
jgi:hypoxanthine phosphoribosyltransferase